MFGLGTYILCILIDYHICYYQRKIEDIFSITPSFSGLHGHTYIMVCSAIGLRNTPTISTIIMHDINVI